MPSHGSHQTPWLRTSRRYWTLDSGLWTLTLDARRGRGSRMDHRKSVTFCWKRLTKVIENIFKLVYQLSALSREHKKEPKLPPPTHRLYHWSEVDRISPLALPAEAPLGVWSRGVSVVSS